MGETNPTNVTHEMQRLESKLETLLESMFDLSYVTLVGFVPPIS